MTKRQIREQYDKELKRDAKQPRLYFFPLHTIRDPAKSLCPDILNLLIDKFFDYGTCIHCARCSISFHKVFQSRKRHSFKLVNANTRLEPELIPSLIRLHLSEGTLIIVPKFE